MTAAALWQRLRQSDADGVGLPEILAQDVPERDVEHGLQVTLAHFVTRAQQERALEILQFKLDVLWSMMDAIALAYPAHAGAASPFTVNPANIGAQQR